MLKFRAKDLLTAAEALNHSWIKGAHSYAETKQSSPDHSLKLNVVDSLGNLYKSQAILENTENMYQRALQGRQKALNPDHPSTLDTVISLGSLHVAQFKVKCPEGLYQRALRGYGKVLGPEHTSTLGMVNNLGSLYKSQEKLKEAEMMYQRKVRILLYLVNLKLICCARCKAQGRLHRESRGINADTHIFGSLNKSSTTSEVLAESHIKIVIIS
jgi:tetratricopeptide (TPR) repeat protein